MPSFFICKMKMLKILKASLVAQQQDMWIQCLGQEDPLEKEMATHPSILVWEILWTEEPGELQSMGLQE